MKLHCGPFLIDQTYGWISVHKYSFRLDIFGDTSLDTEMM